MEEENPWINIGMWIVGILIVLFILHILNGIDDVKAYSATCNEEVKGNICKNPLYANDIEVYTPNVGKQYVIISHGGYVEKYTKCVVKDKNDWQCDFDDNSGNFGFASGQFFDYPNYDVMHSSTGELMKKMYYPSRFEYINLVSKNCGSFYPLCYVLYTLTQ